MKILIYRRSSLIGTHGGVEKVVSSLANSFQAHGHQVMIMTRDKRKGELFYPVHNDVQLVNLFPLVNKKMSLLRSALYKLALSTNSYKKWFAKFPYCDRNLAVSEIVAKSINAYQPDVILSCGITDTVDIIYKQEIKAPIIQMFHSLPEFYFKIGNKVKREIVLDCLKKTTAAQVLCPSFVENLRPYYDKDIQVIGNPVLQAKEIVNHHLPKEKHTIIYLARLGKEKQQDLLIKSFALIAKEFPKWEVQLWGGASAKVQDELQHLIDELQMTDRIRLCGVTHESYKELAKADICAFPSSFEGFGLGLAEAMTCGLPCVGLKACSGVNEIIRDKVTGYLTTAEDFAEKLKELMLSADLRAEFGKAGHERVKEFAPEEIDRRWEEMLAQICSRKA